MRRLYRLILRAHPKRFRERFESEMLCVFDEAVGREGVFRLTIDGIASLLRQRVFRNQSRPAAAPNIFGSYLVAHQPALLKMSHVILGGAISFNLFLLAFGLLGGGRAHSAQHQETSTNEAFAAQALPPSDVTRLSDECPPVSASRVA